MGFDYQRGRGLVVSISISRRDPLLHVPGVPLRRRDLSALRARAFGRISKQAMSPAASEWVRSLEQQQWEDVLAGVRLLPWIGYAALWLLADPLARKAGEEDDGDLGSGLVHGAGAASIAQVGKALAERVAEWVSSPPPR